MAKEMYDYLSAVTADYTTTELTVTPQEELVETGEKEQFVHKFSDGSRGVVTISSTSHFIVTLTWTVLTAAEAEIILDMFHSESKANGIAKSFYWPHPTDGHTYTVKFADALSQVFKASMPGVTGTRQITLDIIGVKP